MPVIESDIIAAPVDRDLISFCAGFVCAESIGVRCFLAALIDALQGDRVFRDRLIETLCTPTERDRMKKRIS